MKVEAAADVVLEKQILDVNGMPGLKNVGGVMRHRCRTLVYDGGNVRQAIGSMPEVACGPEDLCSSCFSRMWRPE